MKSKLLFIIILFISVTSWFAFKPTNYIKLQNTNSLDLLKTADSKIPQTLKLLFLGDANMATEVGEFMEQGLDPFIYVTDHFQKYDWVVMNLETNVAEDGVGSPANKTFTFQAPVEAIPRMKFAGVDMVSLANNHTMDFGPDALIRMIELLDQYEVSYFGAGKNSQEAFDYTFVEFDDLSIAFIGVNNVEGFSQNAGANRPGSAYFDQNLLKQTLDEANQVADLVFVMPHWGIEHELFADEYQTRWAHFFIDNGADLVVGAHPHVRQNVEIYKEKEIHYSLGNFIFSGMGWNPEAVLGSMLEVEVDIETKQIIQTKLQTVEINTHGFPRIVNASDYENASP